MIWRCDKCGLSVKVEEWELPVHHDCSQQQTPLDCTHRGPAIDTHTCQLCGNRGKEIEVYSCDLHGKCVLRRWSNRNQEAKEGERICLICADRG